jgi:hypothetical protein
MKLLVLLLLYFSTFNISSKEVTISKSYSLGLGITSIESNINLQSLYYNNQSIYKFNTFYTIDLSYKLKESNLSDYNYSLYLGIKYFQPVNDKYSEIRNFTLIEPYYFERKVGSRKEVYFLFHLTELFKNYNKNLVFSLGMSIGQSESISIAYKRVFLDSFLLNSQQLNSVSYLGVPITVPESVSLFFKPRVYYSYNLGASYKVSDFRFGIDIILGNYIEKQKADININTSYLHYSKNQPYTIYELFLRERIILNALEYDEKFRGIRLYLTYEF